MAETESQYHLHLKEKLKEIRQAGKKIVLAPMGIHGKFYVTELRQLFGVSAGFFFGNSKDLWGTSYNGVRCLSMPELMGMKNDTVILVGGQHCADGRSGLVFRHITDSWTMS